MTCFYSRHIRSTIVLEHGHNKYTRPADVRWITIEDLEPDRQYQFWVTAVTSAGEGRSSDVITQSPGTRIAAKITSLSRVVYTPIRTNLNLQCSYLGEPIPKAIWSFNSQKDPTWLQRRTAYGQSNAYLENLSRDKHSGNYTCSVENTLGSDKITYQVLVQGNFFRMLDHSSNHFSIHFLGTGPGSRGIHPPATTLEKFSRHTPDDFTRGSKFSFFQDRKKIYALCADFT